jgi:hypothetical protein
VIAELRATLGITCPALLITGDVEVHQNEQLRELGITLMQKPVRVAALRSAIRACVPLGRIREADNVHGSADG